MRFDDACIPLPLLWSSPFIRWQGAAADVSALDLAVQVTRDALAAAAYDPAETDDDEDIHRQAGDRQIKVHVRRN